MKTIFANDVMETCKKLGISYNMVSNTFETLFSDQMGNSHWKQPGPDGKMGYSGKCFPKDTEATAKLIETCGISNNFARWAQDKNNALILKKIINQVEEL